MQKYTQRLTHSVMILRKNLSFLRTASMYLKPTWNSSEFEVGKLEYKKSASDKMQLSGPFCCCDHRTVKAEKYRNDEQIHPRQRNAVDSNMCI